MTHVVLSPLRRVRVIIASAGQIDLFHQPCDVLQCWTRPSRVTVADSRDNHAPRTAACACSLQCNGQRLALAQAQNTGGGIQQISGMFSLSNSTFMANVAQQIGGGFASRESEGNITACDFLNNTAINGQGGGAYLDNAIASVVNSRCDRSFALAVLDPPCQGGSGPDRVSLCSQRHSVH